MRKFIIHIMLFGILFFVAEKGLYYFILNAPKKEYDKRLEMVLEGQMNKDIIILGSSRGANNIIAKQLEEETKWSTYNLSYRGSDVDFHEFILSTLLKYNESPKTVLLVIDNVHEFKYTPTLNFRFDRLYPLKTYRYINDELISRGRKNILSKVFCAARINKKDFNLKNVEVLPINIMSAHGSKIIESKNKKDIVFDDSIKAYSIINEQKEKLTKFNKIQKLCEKNNIELIFVFPPNYGIFNTAFYERFKKSVTKDNKIMVYDSLNAVYKNENYYRDESHLLKNGAEIFTSEISDFINNNK